MRAARSCDMFIYAARIMDGSGALIVVGDVALVFFRCSATIKVRMRIASPEMLPSIVVLPHLKCSQRWLGGKDEEGQYGDAERIG